LQRGPKHRAFVLPEDLGLGVPLTGGANYRLKRSKDVPVANFSLGPRNKPVKNAQRFFRSRGVEPCSIVMLKEIS
jgi:hypothetical protein